MSSDQILSDLGQIDEAQRHLNSGVLATMPTYLVGSDPHYSIAEGGDHRHPVAES